MKTFIDRRAFTIVELLVVIAVLVAALTLLLPAVSRQARDEDKANQCANNLKQLGLAAAELRRQAESLPPISTNVDAVPDVPGDASPIPDTNTTKGPGTDATPAAGYSWCVLILPDLEQVELYQSIVTTSNKFTLPAFSPKVMGKPGRNEPHPATISIAALRCPQSTDGPMLDTSARTVAAGKKYESGTLPPNYAGELATANGAKGIALTNYNAILGTHIDPDKKSASVPNNGGMMFRGTMFDQGRKLAAMTDGTSKVPVIAETNETRFSSWYDGTMNWVVAARHSNPKDGTKPITPVSKFSGQAGNAQVKDRLIVGTDGTQPTPAATHSTMARATTTAAPLIFPRALWAIPIFPPRRLAGSGARAANTLAASCFTLFVTAMSRASQIRSIPICTSGSSAATAASQRTEDWPLPVAKPNKKSAANRRNRFPSENLFQ